jgi:uncharacterized protein
MDVVRDEAALSALYGESSPGAIAKEIDYIHPHYRAMIEASPFMVLATSGPEGLDASPRGDPAGFVHVLDDKTADPGPARQQPCRQFAKYRP